MRKLLKIAAAACVTLALAAPTAAAQTVEVSTESGGVHCGSVTVTSHDVSGGCLTHIVNNSLITSYLNGMPMGSCTMELLARIDEAGGGYVYDQYIPQAGTCRHEACREPGPGANKEWPIQIDEVDTGIEHIVVQACLKSSVSPSEFLCTFEAAWVDAEFHHYAINASFAYCTQDNGIAIDGSWYLEAPNIEVQHLE
jgi:hypothetical protein